MNLQSREATFFPFSLVAEGENMWQKMCPEIWFQMIIYKETDKV